MRLLITLLFLLHLPLLASTDLDAYLGFDDMLSMQVSPDGKYIAANSFDGEEFSILFFDSQSLQVVDAMKFRYPDIIGDMVWVSKDRIVAKVYRYFYNQDNEFSIGELFSAKVKDTRGKYIFGYRAGKGDNKTPQKATITSKHRNMSRAWASIIDLLKDDPKHILVAARPWRQDFASDTHIYKVNVETANIIPVSILNKPYANVFTDNNGNLIGAVSRKSDYSKQVYLYDKQSETWQLEAALTEVDDFRFAYFDQTRNSINFFSSYQTDKQNLYSYDLKTKQIKLLFADENVDVYRLHSAGFNKPPYALSTEPALREYVPLNQQHELSPLFSAMLSGFRDHYVDIISTSDNTQKVIYKLTSNSMPGRYYLYDGSTSTSTTLAEVNQTLAQKKSFVSQPFEFKRAGKQSIHGYVTLPDNTQVQPIASVFLLNNAPHFRRTTSDFNKLVQLYASQGYAVIQANLPGTIGYGDDFHYIGEKQWQRQQSETLVATLEWLSEQHPIAANKTCLLGSSFGAYSAVLASVHFPDKFSCVIGLDGKWSFEHLQEKSRLADTLYGDALFDLYYSSDDEKVKTWGLKSNASAINTPVMFVHREAAKEQPISYIKSVYKQLINRGVDAELVEIEQESRFDEKNKAMAKAYSKIFKFLSRHLQ